MKYTQKADMKFQREPGYEKENYTAIAGSDPLALGWKIRLHRVDWYGKKKRGGGRRWCVWGEECVASVSV